MPVLLQPEAPYLLGQLQDGGLRELGGPDHVAAAEAERAVPGEEQMTGSGQNSTDHLRQNALILLLHRVLRLEHLLDGARAVTLELLVDDTVVLIDKGVKLLSHGCQQTLVEGCQTPPEEGQ